MFDLEVESLWSVFFFWVGACLGSFANVVIYRLPKNQSVVSPRSHCYSCNQPIKWFDNIPIISYLVLRGKCRNCMAKFSVRYLLVELLMASLFALAFVYYGWSYTLIEVLIFIFGIVVCVFIDFDHFILPDIFTLSGIVIGFIGSILIPERSILDSIFGILLGGGFLWALAFIYYQLTGREGMGGGDIKLLAWIGAVLGWKAVPFVILVSSIVGSLVGIVVSLKSKSGLKAVIPFGPYLGLGALLYLFGGQAIALWYISLFIPSI